MSNSLREQLINAGLAKPKLEEKKNPKKSTRLKNKSKPAATSPVNTLQDKTDTQSLSKDSRQLIKTTLRRYKLNDKNAEIAYNYAVNNQIKRFYVSETQRQQIADGQLAIVNWNDISYLIDVSHLTELRNLYSDLPVFHLNEKDNSRTNITPSTGDDIPDDLVW